MPEYAYRKPPSHSPGFLRQDCPYLQQPLTLADLGAKENCGASPEATGPTSGVLLPGSKEWREREKNTVVLYPGSLLSSWNPDRAHPRVLRDVVNEVVWGVTK